VNVFFHVVVMLLSDCNPLANLRGTYINNSKCYQIISALAHVRIFIFVFNFAQETLKTLDIDKNLIIIIIQTIILFFARTSRKGHSLS